jgi:hypothetical protein
MHSPPWSGCWPQPFILGGVIEGIALSAVIAFAGAIIGAISALMAREAKYVERDHEA